MNDLTEGLMFAVIDDDFEQGTTVIGIYSTEENALKVLRSVVEDYLDAYSNITEEDIEWNDDRSSFMIEDVGLSYIDTFQVDAGLEYV